MYYLQRTYATTGKLSTIFTNRQSVICITRAERGLKMAKVFFGKIIHTKSLNEFEVFPSGFVAVDQQGQIAGIGNESDYCEWLAQNAGFKGTSEENLTSDQFVMPGFVDCHIHAPQVAQIGLGLDMPLLDWLNTYTFPLEAKYDDQDFAANVYTKVVENTIRAGTTLASYFGSNNKDSTLILSKQAMRQGQRALVGKVCSNRNSPDFYVETTETSAANTEEFVNEIKKLKTDLVKPIITPRFALSCTKELMVKLGEIARRNDLHIQSHISENLAEIEYVKSIYNSCYAEAYDNAGLLTPKTVMAHAVHLEDAEVALFRERGTSVAHCPSSNTNLSSGFCDVMRLIKNGVKVGLGTDVSGGNSMSIKDAILRALDVSHHLEFVKKQEIKGSGRLNAQDNEYRPLNYKQAIFLATLGGAEALALGDVTGNFMVGKDFDALIVDTSKYPLWNYVTVDAEKSSEAQLLEMVQKFIYVGDDRNIISVYVAGKQIKKFYRN
ncbi:PREDICTED: guanine deaminase-like isoform X4 [Rhagoletis zephyria]|uniref:guanine deaminase-like isoform X4 n=1 Tax=Rhagoletis zephyria TaxID=28612 RepID=UPI0008112AC0|nr:PREDICTED: guanine deaminase-like isoform X4 [Rhagoletis zephyria]